MNMPVMKKIDHYCGIPVCLLLDAFCRIERLLPKKTSKFKPKQLLFMKFFGMGSILLASPLLQGVRDSLPEARIGFLTFAANRDITERLKLADTVYTLRTDTLWHFCYDLVQALRAIRAARYDVTIDMEFFSKFSTIVTYLSGSPTRIGFYLRQMWRGDLLTHHVYYNHYKHITEVFAALVAPLGININNGSVAKPHFTEQERQSIRRLLKDKGVPETTFIIGVNINVSDLSPERRWPAESFRELAITLLERYDACLVFIGTQEDRPRVEQVIASLPYDSSRVVSLAGQTSLGELLALIESCRLFISNDSGPLHLAAAIGTPVTAFFGPETPQLYGPVGSNSLVLYQELYCSPCLNVFNVKTAPCSGRNLCMQGIMVDDVITGMRSRFPSIWKPLTP